MIFLLCLITYVNFITSNPTSQADYLLQEEANTTISDLNEDSTGEFTVTEMSSTSIDSEPIIKSDHDASSVEEVTSNEPDETTTESDEPMFDNDQHNGDNHQSSEHHNDNQENHEDDHEHDRKHEHEHDHEHHHEHKNDYNKADIHKRTRGKHSDSTNPKKVNKL
ncbi:unnamed protein product [Schistosoma bovis]|nr:unnamed protein product [Schistosoma bovis]